ncbi:MAG: YcjF family protein [Rhizobiaceae bacterium]|nr:YcjF family protein [Rhizobiaceae bacterium]
MSKQPRKPRIVQLNGDSSKKTRVPASRRPMAQNDLSLVVASPQAEEIVKEFSAPSSPPVKTGFPWLSWFLGAAAALLSLGAGLAIDQLIVELFERQTWLGWAASAAAALLVLAAIAIILREIWGISRLNTISALREKAIKIQAGERPKDGINLVRDLDSLYSSRADMANVRSKFAQDRINILDGQDLLTLFETTYMSPIDEQAKSLVMQSAKRVSLVTAISPRALVDIAYVMMENIRLIRRLSTIYGGRPGALGFWRLTRNILGHLAQTGAIAAGDSLIQQFVGHGIAARLSTKLGEGVVNGMLTARIGIAAMDLARPMPFNALPRPGVSEYFKELTRSFSSSDKI